MKRAALLYWLLLALVCVGCGSVNTHQVGTKEWWAHREDRFSTW